MPYKNAEQRRAKQRECMKRLRGVSSGEPAVKIIIEQPIEPIVQLGIETKVDVNPNHNGLIKIETQEKKKPWGWTINGVFIPLEVRPEMPAGYI